jgi:putative DNA primase/helicase
MAAATSDIDLSPWLLNTLNGTLDLHTGQLQPHDPADMLTKLVQANYDADAQCPIWLAFLARVQPDPAIRTFLQRSIGYSPTGLVSEQLRLWLATQMQLRSSAAKEFEISWSDSMV